MKRRGVIASSAIGTAILAVGVIAVMIGGGNTPHSDTSLDASDSTTPQFDLRKGYARSGRICYPADATGITATCFSANVQAWTVDATDTGWPVEPAQVNRLPTNSSMSCDGTPFVCTTATMDSTTVAPDSSTTASTFTMGGGSADATAFGYTNSTALDLRMYLKCPAGIFDASNIGGAGHWTVDGTALGSGWQLVTPTHSAVTQVQAWTSNGSGGVRMRFSGNDCAVWQPTASEALADPRSTRFLGTVPTSDATGSSVGATTWTVDNSSGAYWAASGVTKVEAITQHTGTCWSYSAPTITLDGCHGIWYALSLTWSY